MRTRFPAALLCLLAVACSNAGEDLGLPPLSVGGVTVGVIVDRDGSGAPSAFDTVYNGAKIALFMRDGVDTIRIANTNANGIAAFTSLPIGRYRYAVIPSSVGDTLPVIRFGEVEFTIRADSLFGAGTAEVSYATLTLDEARQAPPGRRVFIHGIVTSPLQVFSDSAMFVKSGSRQIRITSAAHRPGRTGNNLGDSVVVLGTTGSDAGQPVLLGGLVLTLGTGPAPVPVDLTVGEAATARGGELDAGLVRMTGGAIADTATVGAEWHVWVTDTLTMNDTTLVVFDALLQVTKSAYVPGRRFTSRGVLIPDGNGSWFLKPRPVSGEVVLF